MFYLSRRLKNECRKRSNSNWGASGTGKSSIAYELGKLLHMNIVQVDDFQCLVEAATKECDYIIGKIILKKPAASP